MRMLPCDQGRRDRLGGGVVFGEFSLSNFRRSADFC